MIAETQDSIIDAHIHVWAADREKHPLAPGFEVSDLLIPSYEPDDHFQICRRHGVGRVNLVQMTYYGTDHSYILDIIAGDPERFVGTGVVPAVTDISVGSPGDTMIALSRGGIYAFRVRGKSARPRPLGDGAQWMDHPGYQEMFEAGAKHDLAISFLISVADLQELDRMCARFPETPVIIDHLCLIGADGRFPEQDIDALCRMARHEKVMMKVGPFNNVGSKVRPYLDVLPLVERVVGAFGPERCMWESNGPAARPGIYDADLIGDYEASLALIRDHADFLTASDKEQVLLRTAETFFFER